MGYLDMEREGDEILWRIISQLIQENMKIAEIGCGNTSLLNRICRKYKVDGICFDPYGYSKNIVRIEGERIDEYGEKYHLIYSIRSFHHLSNVEKFIKSSYLSLENKGYLVIVDWKKGVSTGVQERYYSVDEILPYFKKYFKIKHEEKQWNFCIVARKNL